MDTTPGPDPGSADPEPVGAGAPGVPRGTTGADAGDAGDRAADAGDAGEGVVDGDDVADGDDGPGPHDPLRFNQWMKRSATGAVLSGIALGLQQALEPKRELPAFVMEAPGGPEDPDAPISLHFDPDDPTKTVAVIRTPSTAPDEPTPVDGDRPEGSAGATR